MSDEARVCEAPDCDNEYTPRGRGRTQRYCSKRCCQRLYAKTWTYGCTVEDLRDLWVGQEGTCAMPGCTEPLGQTWHVDHCHDTEAIRGLLCPECNKAEGYWRRAEALGVREYLGVA
jgi:hypothetical protein